MNVLLHLMTFDPPLKYCFNQLTSVRWQQQSFTKMPDHPLIVFESHFSSGCGDIKVRRDGVLWQGHAPLWSLDKTNIPPYLLNLMLSGTAPTDENKLYTQICSHIVLDFTLIHLCVCGEPVSRSATGLLGVLLPEAWHVGAAIPHAICIHI